MCWVHIGTLAKPFSLLLLIYLSFLSLFHSIQSSSPFLGSKEERERGCPQSPLESNSCNRRRFWSFFSLLLLRPVPQFRFILFSFFFGTLTCIGRKRRWDRNSLSQSVRNRCGVRAQQRRERSGRIATRAESPLLAVSSSSSSAGLLEIEVLCCGGEEA